MENIERRVRREVRAMTRQEVITKAIARQMTLLQAAQILGPAAPRSGKALLKCGSENQSAFWLAARRGA